MAIKRRLKDNASKGSSASPTHTTKDTQDSDHIDQSIEPCSDGGGTSSTAVKSKPLLCTRCFHWLKYFVLLILIPPFLNYAALQQEQHIFQQTGTLYDIGGGQKLYFACFGTGKPTVLLEAPTGSSSDVWGLLVPLLSNTTKVCVYDRAGLGNSDRPFRQQVAEKSNGEDANAEKLTSAKRDRWHPYTVESMVDDVYRLISFSSQQVEKPFIYVGSELGAMVARFYTQIYETDVSDLVLVDPLVENLFSADDVIWTDFWFNHLIPSYQTMQIAASTGISRIALLLGAIEQPMHDANMDENLHKKQKHLLCHPRHLSTVVDEHHFINESFSQMQTVFSMKQFPSNVPITVITGNYYDEQLPSPLNKAWAKSQQFLISNIHPTSKHIVVNGADRKMIYKKPEALAEPIKRLIKQNRKKIKSMNS